MFLGSRVDDALSLYYRRILEHGERLDARAGQGRLPRPAGTPSSRPREEKLGIDWSDIHQHTAFELGLQALELTFEQLVPEARRAARGATPDRVRARTGPREWTVVCYLDLETRGPGLTGEQIHRVVDYKVKANPINQPKADRDSQASLYLAGRWLEGRPQSSRSRRSPSPDGSADR